MGISTISVPRGTDTDSLARIERVLTIWTDVLVHCPDPVRWWLIARSDERAQPALGLGGPSLAGPTSSPAVRRPAPAQLHVRWELVVDRGSESLVLAVAAGVITDGRFGRSLLAFDAIDPGLQQAIVAGLRWSLRDQLRQFNTHAGRLPAGLTVSRFEVPPVVNRTARRQAVASS